MIKGLKAQVPIEVEARIEVEGRAARVEEQLITEAQVSVPPINVSPIKTKETGETYTSISINIELPTVLPLSSAS